jgi:hypothetical protein
MVWTILGALGIYISQALHVSAGTCRKTVASLLLRETAAPAPAA